MVRPGEPAHERQQIGLRVHLGGIEFRQQFLRKLLVNEGNTAEKRLVEQRETDQRANPEILVRLEHGFDGLGLDARGDIAIVAQRGRAAVHSLDRADHRAQVNVARE